MTSALLSILFIVSMTLALGTIVISMRRYGAQALALRTALHDCSDIQEIRFQLTRVNFRPANATILRPDFRAKAERPAQARAQRAAA